jgi:hypothetical protein
VEHATALELTAGLHEILRSPRDEGPVKLIVRRLGESEREVLTKAALDLTEGLVGDTWRSRGSRRTADQLADPKMQVTVMNARVAALVAIDDERWKLAGDQLYADFDLSESNLPPGTRLGVGSAVIEVTDAPHLGCKKFRERFGEDALRFVNSEAGRKLRLRGVNTRVVRSGLTELGDTIRKLGLAEAGDASRPEGVGTTFAYCGFRARMKQKIGTRSQPVNRDLSGGLSHAGSRIVSITKPAASSARA